MESKLLKAFGYLAIGLILFVATLIVIRWAVDFATWATLSAAEAGTWMGAIGTVGTLIAAVHLAHTETRQRKHEALVVARLRGASMVLRLVHVQAVLAEILRLFDEAAQVDMGPRYFETARFKLAGIDLWSIDELIPLAPLPSNTAIKLAEVADQLATLRKILDKAITDQKRYNGDSRMAMARGLHTNLSGTYRFVDEAVKVCRAGVEATHLSLQDD